MAKKAHQEKELAEVADKPALIAKKAFVICQNEYLRKIQEGEDVSDVPERFLVNLKTEGVI